MDKKSKMANPKSIILGLCVLLLLVILAQSFVAQTLQKSYSEKGSENNPETVLKDGKSWDRYWSLATGANDPEKLVEAEQALTKAVKEAEKFGNKDARLAANLNCLARLYDRQGQLEKAAPLYKKALDIDQAVLGKDQPGLINDMQNLALVYIRQGKLEKAEELYQKSIETSERLYSSDQPERVAADMTYLVLLYDKQGKVAEAEKLCRKALAINEKKYGKDDPVVAANLSTLALLLSRQGKYDAADTVLTRAVQIWNTKSKAENQNLADNLQSYKLVKESFYNTFIDGEPDKSARFPDDEMARAKALRTSLKPEEAETLLKGKLEDAKKAGRGTTKLGMYLVRLNNALFDQGKDAEAIKYGEIAYKLFDKHPEEASRLAPWYVNVHSYLAMSNERRANFDLAVVHYRKALSESKQAPAEKVGSVWIGLLKKGLSRSQKLVPGPEAPQQPTRVAEEETPKKG